MPALTLIVSSGYHEQAAAAAHGEPSRHWWVVCAHDASVGAARARANTIVVMETGRHPLSRLVGDLLVLQPSASGRSRSRRIPFEAEYGMHLGPANHLALLNHPMIYERLQGWLSAPPG